MCNRLEDLKQFYRILKFLTDLLLNELEVNAGKRQHQDRNNCYEPCYQ